MKAKKKFGQNFLKNDYYINRIIDSINVFSNDIILEIGPGHGALTQKLKNKNCNLIAYEIDQDLIPELKKLENEKTKIINQDFLTLKEFSHPNQEIFVVGNLPYYITTPILEHIIKINLDPKEMIIMVQKEVANRFLAKPCSKDYGYFTLYLQYFFDITKIVDVPNTAFDPVPKVVSTILKFKRRENKVFLDINKYQIFLKKIFSQKRKQLKNNLNNDEWILVNTVLINHNIKSSVRAEELSEEIIIEIFKTLNNNTLK